jgi:hypothetical protein
MFPNIVSLAYGMLTQILDDVVCFDTSESPFQKGL